MNLERLIEIRNLVTENPEHFCMLFWDTDFLTDEDNLKSIKLMKNSCGTSRCIAGWACFLYDENYVHNTKNKNPQELAEYFFNKGKELLQLTEEDSHCLFYGWNNKLAINTLDVYITEAKRFLLIKV